MRDQHSEFGNQGKVLLHVGGKDHVHHNAPDLPLLALRQPPQEVAIQLLIPQQPASTAMVRCKFAQPERIFGSISWLQAVNFRNSRVEGSTVILKDLTTWQGRPGSTWQNLLTG